MPKAIMFLLALLGVVTASNMHNQQRLAQIQDIRPVSDNGPFLNFGNITDIKNTQDYCDEQSLNVRECLDFIRTNNYDGVTHETFNWQFEGQVDCWIKYSETFGYEYISDWIDDPMANEHFAFTMPNTRHYEHFYNDEGCNQIFVMGRGREQPDAITFYDIHVHEYNMILSLDRKEITPWVTHDQMVLQFFGVTEQCVDLWTEMEGMGRGLVDGQFRIEYYNSTGLTYIDGSDFGKTGQSYSEMATDSLLESDVCICRTPHYLEICHFDHCQSCTAGCEYFPAFTSNDDSLFPFTHYGNYTVPCHAGSVFTFNGTASDADNSAADADPGNIKTKNLIFEDKCEADAFVMSAGQTIVIMGNLTGHLEVLLDTEHLDNTGATLDTFVDMMFGGSDSFDLFEFWMHGVNYLDETVDTSGPIKVNTDTVIALFTETSIDATALFTNTHDQVRVWVYAKHGTFDICAKACPIAETPTVRKCISNTPGEVTGPQPTPDTQTDMEEHYFGGVTDEGSLTTPVDMMTMDDFMNSGLGNDFYAGGTGDDWLEDHGGRDVLFGNAGSDILVSRDGGDILFGGGQYTLYEVLGSIGGAACVDLDMAASILDNTGNACGEYTTDPTRCGLFDVSIVPTFFSSELCCACGGGTITPLEIAADDGVDDCNTYIIYPTHEKNHHFDWTPRNTKTGADFTCTKIPAMTLDDTIEFRMDDPTYSDYKYTNEDDNCVLRVDGWEIDWYLGKDEYTEERFGFINFEPSVSPSTPVTPTALSITVLDVWFSRSTQMAHICVNQEGANALTRCSGGPDGEVSNPYCLAYWVQCDDQDPWPETDLDDYITNLDILNWYGYW